MTHNLTTPGVLPWYPWTLDASSNAVNPGDILCALANGNARRADNGLYIPAVVNAPATTLTNIIGNVAVASLSATQYAVAWVYNSATVAATIVTVSGSTVTPGVITTIASPSNPLILGIAALSSGTFVIGYTAATNFPWAVACTVSGTTITVGTPVQMASTAQGGTINTAVAALSSSAFVMVYTGTSSFCRGQVCTVSGTTITLGTDTALNAIASTLCGVCALSSTSFAACYLNTGPFAGTVACTVSGQTITAGTPVTLNGTSSSQMCIAALDSTDYVVCWVQAGKAQGIVCSVSGTTVTPGAQVALTGASGVTNLSVTSPVSSTFVNAYENSGTTNIEAVVSTQAAGVITAGTQAVIVYTPASGSSTVTALATIDTTDVFLANATTGTGNNKALYGGVLNFNGTTINSTGTKATNTIGMAVNSAVAGGTLLVATTGQLTGLPVTLTTGSYYGWDRIGGTLTSYTTTDHVGFALNSNTIIVKGSASFPADQYFG